MSMQVNIVSAAASIYSGTADLVVATAIWGEIGIRSKHAPLLAALKPGEVRVVRSEGQDIEELFYISGGYIEVQPDIVTILADTAAHARSLDEAEAIAAEERARGLLIQHRTDFDYSAARAELAQAVARLRVLRQLRRKEHIS